MFDLDRWQEIWVTITRNKMRSILTAFGVFWGIFMLVVMAGSGKGLENGIMEGIRGFSTNSCFFWTNSTSEPYKGFRKGRYWNMKNSDVEIIRSKVSHIQYITPMIFGGNSANNTVHKDKAGAYNVKGFYPVYDKIDHQQLIYGRFINDIDIYEKRKVCVIGRRVYEELFQKGQNPVGELVKVNGMYYCVVGVINPITMIGINGPMEESVILPFTTMQQAYNYGDKIHLLCITAEDDYKVSLIEDQIKTVLKEQHSISPTDSQAVGGVNLEKQFTMFHYLFLGISILVWIVGLGTLFAGIVGVSNIMLVTVRERTKEIGIRRALGAKPRVIISQIISESLILTLLAGMLGLCLGVGLLTVVDSILTATRENTHEGTFFAHPQVSFWSAILALVILVFAGIIAGFIPAWRALQIKAIDAIREE
ncbi:ABC transporter permease [Parabacteroides sp. FAFU027]|uniref:ABC transporter permease n=1 Tax=Parabacteroides sp. FAFU027 TaxID=2922715 RepID=UPI001FAFB2EA|nr:ABC transporter permease [Parabacteroides sp. FAFU027]